MKDLGFKNLWKESQPRQPAKTTRSPMFQVALEQLVPREQRVIVDPVAYPLDSIAWWIFARSNSCAKHCSILLIARRRGFMAASCAGSAILKIGCAPHSRRMFNNLSSWELGLTHTLHQASQQATVGDGGRKSCSGRENCGILTRLSS